MEEADIFWRHWAVLDLETTHRDPLLVWCAAVLTLNKIVRPGVGICLSQNRIRLRRARAGCLGFLAVLALWLSRCLGV